MKRIKDCLYYLYLAALFGMSILLFVKHLNAEAGSIRKIQVSEAKSGVIRLALGQNTTVAFPSRPEKAVPGSPDSLVVNFIKNDLSIRPLNSHPGNLTIYTKTERLVLLFKMGNESNYDDVVQITPFNSRRGMNLVKDTYK